MTFPEENPLSARDQFFIATSAGEYIAFINANTRSGRKTGPADERLHTTEALHRRNAVAEYIGNLRPALACLAIEWAYDEDLRDQVRSNTDPIIFHKAEADFNIEAYADMLVLTAKATKRKTEGKFGGVRLYGTPHSFAENVALQYKIAMARRKNKSS